MSWCRRGYSCATRDEFWPRRGGGQSATHVSTSVGGATDSDMAAPAQDAVALAIEDFGNHPFFVLGKRGITP